MKPAFGGRRKKAFTLIELLVVIAIIGILAAIIVVLLNSARRRAQDAQVKSDITSLSQALEIVKVDRNFTAAGWSDVTDSAVADDSNIDWWREDAWHPGLPGTATKRLVAVKPTHPMAAQTYKITLTTEAYAILARLNATDSYFCNTNGTTKTLTGMTTLGAAQAACTP